MSLRSIIFDCDGVLVDTEPLHFAAFRDVLARQGDELTEEQYKERYLALDDRGAFEKFFRDRRKPLEIARLGELLNEKTKAFQDLVSSEGILPFPAVPEFVMAASQRYPLAVASGCRRHELEMVLEAAGIRTYFEKIVSADDVKQGKPDPESYLRAVEELNASGKRQSAIRPDECAVIEDSREGIHSAHSAGMKCVAVTTSYPSFELSLADLIVPSLGSLRLSQVEDLFQRPPALQPVPNPQPN
ncbi:MAG: HAD family phosphatase [Elusimicrobia bacterium]|nr:HAD family phosphatase [Elusimicrobiota bacterium]